MSEKVIKKVCNLNAGDVLPGYGEVSSVTEIIYYPPQTFRVGVGNNSDCIHLWGCLEIAVIPKPEYVVKPARLVGNGDIIFDQSEVISVDLIIETCPFGDILAVKIALVELSTKRHSEIYLHPETDVKVVDKS